MQQQQPGMPPFSPAAGTPVGVGQHAATPVMEQKQQVVVVGVDELGGSALADHEGMSSAGGDEGDRGGPSGNRWPRQETLALLKIRSEMDAAFREAALKGPLWDQVSRKLEAMGYKRSAKKCREKFENVDKYYKRTKDGRAGRGDGKAYRFFSELEALHGGGVSSSPAPMSMAPTPVSSMAPPGTAPAMPQPQPPAPLAASDAACMMTPGDLSFSSGSDGEDTTEETGCGGGKRKRQGGGKMMRFFEGLMRQVMERQEEMQQRFMEAMERREQDRMIREEAWRRQEVARLAREQDALAQERAMAASRDAAVVSFIQRVTGQTIPMPSVVISALAQPPLQPTPVASAPAPAPAAVQHQQPPPSSVTHRMSPPKPTTTTMPRTATTTTAVQDPASPSRWPKAEVHALIQLRTELEARYQDSGPKGPLWEDISSGMRRLGYHRSAKRCKEKWENINKYFKKVKESNKKRPDDSKTCPYYHQLDALYRTKQARGTSSGAGAGVGAAAPEQPALAAVPLSQTAPHADKDDCTNGCSSSRGSSADNGGSSGAMQTQASNGGAAAATRFQGAGGNGGVAMTMQEGFIITNKQETAAAIQPRPQPVSMNDSYVNDTVDSDDSSMEDDDDGVDDDEDDVDDDDVGSGNSKMQYEIQFQRQRQQQNASGAAGSGGPGPAAATSGSFLTMVHH